MSTDSGELALRLADAQAIVSSVNVDEDTGELVEDAGSLLSALGYALCGLPGCIEPEEWQAQREEHLRQHAPYLGIEPVHACPATHDSEEDSR